MTTAQAEVPGAKAEPEIHLYAGQTTGGEAMIPIRWCICPTLFARLQAEDAEKPHLLLVVAKKGKEVLRKLLPLQQAMEYVTFSKPGEYEFFANVVWDKENKVGRLKTTFLAVSQQGNFCYNVLDFDHENGRVILYTAWPGVYSEGPKEPLLTVNVAKEFFAKEPPEWLRSWVNWMFESPLRDQCQFRRRCILAFSIQPPMALICFTVLFLARLVSALFLFFFLGWRGVNFKPVVLLRKLKTEDIWFDHRDFMKCHMASIFTTDEKGNDRPLFVGALSWFLPTMIFIAQVILRLLGRDSHNLFQMGIVSLGLWMGVVALLVICHFLWKPIAEKREAARLAEMKDPAVYERERLEERARLEKERRLLQARFERRYLVMVCPGVALKASVGALPKSQRTLRLRFYELKRRVCKPFARS